MKIKEIEQKAKEFASFLVAEDQVQQPLIDLLTTAMYWALSHQWVSVEDELPPPMSKKDHISDRVIVHTSLDCVFVDHYDHYSQEWIRATGTNYATGRVTHWIPIPPLAEEGGEK